MIGKRAPQEAWKHLSSATADCVAEAISPKFRLRLSAQAFKTMLQVHLESKRVSVRNASLPRTPAGFARIRMLAAGICSTDLELQRGYYGFSGTPGHEFAGEVVTVNGSHEEQANWLGQRVAGEINLACAHCDWCSRGLVQSFCTSFLGLFSCWRFFLPAQSYLA